MPVSIVPLLLALLPTPQEPDAGGFAALAAQVRTDTLDNGLRVVVLPRGEAPVASFRVYVQTGAIDETSGHTGLAHFAEHMAFKGSRRIGSRDWERERVALAGCDEAWAAYEAAATGRVVASESEITALREAFVAARDAADALSDASAFDRAVEEAGGLDQNASTGADQTQYYVSLPARRLEQWFWLTREQIAAPVLREFYKERDVVMEERRMRSESSPGGALMEALLQTAFVAHPYRDTTIGHMDDLRWLDRPEMEAFWARHYGADRIVIAIVGRVDADEVFRLARRYLGDLPRGEARPPRTSEPLQDAPRSVTVARPASPRALLAWHIPPQTGREALVYEALAELLTGTRASRLTGALVQGEALAASLDADAGVPGSVDPSLFVIAVRPVPGQPLRGLVSRVQQELAACAQSAPDERELAGLRRRMKMRMLRAVASDAGLAAALAQAEADGGGWRTLFERLDALETLSGEEIRVAAARLTADRRTTAYLQTTEEGA